VWLLAWRHERDDGDGERDPARTPPTPRAERGDLRAVYDLVHSARHQGGGVCLRTAPAPQGKALRASCLAAQHEMGSCFCSKPKGMKGSPSQSMFVDARSGDAMPMPADTSRRCMSRPRWISCHRRARSASTVPPNHHLVGEASAADRPGRPSTDSGSPPKPAAQRWNRSRVKGQGSLREPLREPLLERPRAASRRRQYTARSCKTAGLATRP